MIPGERRGHGPKDSVFSRIALRDGDLHETEMVFLPGIGDQGMPNHGPRIEGVFPIVRDSSCDGINFIKMRPVKMIKTRNSASKLSTILLPVGVFPISVEVNVHPGVGIVGQIEELPLHCKCIGIGLIPPVLWILHTVP